MTKAEPNFQPVKAYGNIGDRKMMDLLAKQVFTIKFMHLEMLIKKKQ